jgi:hypothetical protein
LIEQRSAGPAFFVYLREMRPLVSRKVRKAIASSPRFLAVQPTIIRLFDKSKIMRQPMPYLLLTLLLFVFSACRGSGDASTTVGSVGANASAQPAAKAAGYKRYGIESGIVEYAVSGAQKGTETLYFDRWGQREATYTDTELSFAGISQKQKTLNILEGELGYNINLATRAGTKTTNPLFKKILDRSPDKNLGDLGLRMLEEMGGVKIGTEEVAGKLCDIWEIKNLQSKSWLWKVVTLKVQVKMAGMEVTKTAARFEEGVSIPEDRFTIPSDIKISEGADIQKALERIKKKSMN